MNILVIGNGFDLAHGLPTKYEHFLNFVKVYTENKHIFLPGKSIKEIWEESEDDEREYLQFFGNFCDQHPKLFSEFVDVISDNIWLEYFMSIYIVEKKAGKDGWIDFENEISKIIQSFDNDIHRLGADYSLDDKVKELSNDFLLEKYSKYTWVSTSGDESSDYHNNEITFREIRDRLLIDLNKLIRALEIYLTVYVNEVQYNEESPDIKEIFEKKDEQGNITAFINTKILSFNYTTTFKRIYKHDFDIDYIHGKADINNTIETNNMVLGIDEYLPKKKRNRETEFIAFKKFYQRIHKGTGCKYKEWTDVIKGDFVDYQIELEKSRAEKNLMNLKVIANKLKKQYLNKHHIYFFGHSLDITDKDILRDLILNDNVHTTIFYHDKDAMGQQIANLVKVIGQDELIRRTEGSTKTIEFKLQQPMKSIDKLR